MSKLSLKSDFTCEKEKFLQKSFSKRETVRSMLMHTILIGNPSDIHLLTSKTSNKTQLYF